MSIILYDLAGADTALRFSPYCWRTKLALKHKGLDYETIPWRFSDRAAIAPTGQAKVPSLIDNGRWVHDSWKIALYLDEAYPDRPPLFPSAQARAQAMFINSWCDWALLPACRALSVPAVYDILAEVDKPYYRTSREKTLGMPIEHIGADKAAAMTAFKHGLKTAEVTLGDQDFLHGAQPGYGDMAMLGTLMWLYVVCRQDPIDRDTAVGRWFERMLAQGGGWIAAAPTARSLAKG